MTISDTVDPLTPGLRSKAVALYEGLARRIGSVARSACTGFGFGFGFGRERISFAPVRRHGFEPTESPFAVRTALGIAA